MEKFINANTVTNKEDVLSSKKCDKFIRKFNRKIKMNDSVDNGNFILFSSNFSNEFNNEPFLLTNAEFDYCQSIAFEQGWILTRNHENSNENTKYILTKK